ncbi:TetR/AcrR family transcriptional regulator [Acetobacter sp.]|jgi:TetR/AcrR family transcriptional repressor of nem operon|uniref:TetR/AcrR family transcriptional regulator n=1 Tax=Acetobacter sp. TaxID=440 RepID=UPI0025BA6073|nr:TetR/AcrR family transcriptional regulator [Acetobacter sp.]MCH4090131.1 TetR/AcrR family transcriptional regulator [Acetobacter sp.]MCI1298827.1 TetR/AcrR family transcriptional regulator [Acetobacter sp.]MCI1314846.1 TetR/AcrR family transcriptional regulator [Acetobacter sp.]
MKKKNTREILIEEGLKAFLMNGFDGIGIQPILRNAGVTKGSFYNFFPSKEAYALEVIDAYSFRYEELRLRIFACDISPLNQLWRYFEELETEIKQAQEVAGCLYGVLSQTSTPHNEVLRNRVKVAFANWQEQLTILLEEAKTVGELEAEVNTTDLAGAIIDAYEGAVVRVRAEGDMKPMRRFRELTLQRLVPLS